MPVATPPPLPPPAPPTPTIYEDAQCSGGTVFTAVDDDERWAQVFTMQRGGEFVTAQLMIDIDPGTTGNFVTAIHAVTGAQLALVFSHSGNEDPGVKRYGVDACAGDVFRSSQATPAFTRQPNPDFTYKIFIIA